MDRIVVTGMGLVSPLGTCVETAWQRLLAGGSGLRVLEDDIVGDLPAKVGGVVPSAAEDEVGFDPDRYIPPKDQKKMDRFIQFAMAAAEEAVRQAGWMPEDKPRGSEPRPSSPPASAASRRSPMRSARPRRVAFGGCRPSLFRRSWSTSQPVRSASATASRARSARL